MMTREMEEEVRTVMAMEVIWYLALGFKEEILIMSHKQDQGEALISIGVTEADSRHFKDKAKDLDETNIINDLI